MEACPYLDKKVHFAYLKHGQVDLWGMPKKKPCLVLWRWVRHAGLLVQAAAVGQQDRSCIPSST